jgi:hypothetical protein
MIMAAAVGTIPVVTVVVTPAAILGAAEATQAAIAAGAIPVAATVNNRPAPRKIA